MKYHEAILKALEVAQIDADPTGAARLVNLAMTIDEVKPEDAQPIYDKVEETVDWMEKFEDTPTSVTETVTAARDWLATKKAEASNENTGDPASESGDQDSATIEELKPVEKTGCCGSGKD